MLDEAELDIRYANLHGTRAGFLPSDRGSITPWNRALQAAAAERAGHYPRNSSVQAFDQLLREDGVVRMLVSQMIDEVPVNHRTVLTIHDLLDQLDHIIQLAPEWETDKSKRHFFPMSTLFTYMMMTEAGESVFRNRRLNDALCLILQHWCKYLDSPASRSVLNCGVNGWLSEPAQEFNKLDEFVIPDRDAEYWGWKSYNDFFHREIKPKCRPIAGLGDPTIVVSPNDGTIYEVARDVALETTFWIKQQPYSVRDMLAGHHLTDSFDGGDVLQSYLQGADYHRWHAPVSGTILSTDNINGLMFSNLASEGNNIKGTGNQGYYTAVNTRGLCFIEADYKPLGIVCVVPVGITEISSIKHTVSHDDHVEKGQEIGRFSYGGSSLATLFQRDAIEYFTVSVPNNPENSGKVKVNGAIAVASQPNDVNLQSRQLEMAE